jgi:hypothetical protein
VPTPDDNAKDLLQAVLSVDPLEVFEAGGFIPVTGSDGGTYQVRAGRSGNVSRLEDGKEVERFCIHQKDMLPLADVLLAQVLLLQCDEATFRKVANSWDPNRRLFEDRPYVPPGLPMDGGRIMPEVPDASGMAQLRFLRRCVMTPRGREALAAALLARMDRAGTEDVWSEVTQLSNMLMRFADLPDEGPSVLRVAEWLGPPHVDPNVQERGSCEAHRS